MGSKVIAFAASAIFEIIALKTGGQVEGEFWLDKPAGLAGFLSRLAQPHLCDTY